MKDQTLFRFDKTTTIDDIMARLDAVADQNIRSSQTTMLLAGMDVEAIDEQITEMRTDWRDRRPGVRTDILETTASARAREDERRRQ